MRTTSLAFAVASAMSLVACGGTDPSLLPDGAVGTPDGDVGSPDGAVGSPDAAVGTPDGDVVGTPDAAPAPDAPPGECGSVEISIGSTVTGSTAGAPNGGGGTCGGGSAGEAIFYFDLTGPADVLVSTDHPGTGYNTAVYLRSICDDPSTQLACASGGMLGDSLVETNVEPGRYYVIVDGVAGGEGDFELSLDILPIVAEGDPCDLTGQTNRCADGSTCTDTPTGPICVGEQAACESGATPLTPPATVMSDTVGLPDVYAPGCSFDGGAGELVYSVDVPAGAYDLVATVTPTNFMGDGFDPILTIETTCGDPATDVGCADSGAEEPETVIVLDAAAGAYYVLVDGWNGTAGAFALDVSLRPVLGADQACDVNEIENRCGGGLACLPAPGGGGDVCRDPFADVCAMVPAADLTMPNTGTLGAGTSQLAPETCGFDGGTTEAIYSVAVSASSFLLVDETALGGGASIYVRGPDSCNPVAEVGCDTGSVRAITTGALTAGTYYVVADGSGAYSLDVAIGTIVPTGGTCDVSDTLRCEDGTFCLDAACVPVTWEFDTPPNAAFCDAQGPFSSDVVIEGDITGGNDFDMFQIDLAAMTTLVIETSDGLGCNVNTLVEVYDAAGQDCMTLDGAPQTPIADDDNSGPEGLCSRLTVPSLVAGTYYVRVRRPAGATGTGMYFLVVDFQ
jgi:hypothetical protein